MIDVDQKVLKLRQSYSIKGTRPVVVDVLKGDYPYIGRYLLTITEDYLYFYQLGLFYNYVKYKPKSLPYRYTRGLILYHSF